MAKDDSKDSGNLRYFKSRMAGLKVVVGEPNSENGEVAPQTVDFVPYTEKFQGDTIRVGYLATDNEVALAKLSGDPNVQEISKGEFERSTDESIDGVKRTVL